MRFWKFIGGLLVFIGCLGALTGIMATAAPMIDNLQVQKIIESFSAKSQDAVVNAMNSVILFCLHNNYIIFGVGAACVLIGGLLKTAAAKALYTAEHDDDEPVSHKAKPAAEKPAAHSEKRPVTPPRPKTATGFSPYAAAEYSKALSASETARAASDIATKYKPRSIIDPPDAAGDALAASLWGDPSTYAKGASGDRAQGAARGHGETLHEEALRAKAIVQGGRTAQPNRDGEVICEACGAGNESGMQYCDQCGSKLPVAAVKRASAETGAKPAYSQTANPWDNPPPVRTSPVDTAFTARTATVTEPYAQPANNPEAGVMANLPRYQEQTRQPDVTGKDDFADFSQMIAPAVEAYPSASAATRDQPVREVAPHSWEPAVQARAEVNHGQQRTGMPQQSLNGNAIPPATAGIAPVARLGGAAEMKAPAGIHKPRIITTISKAEWEQPQAAAATVQEAPTTGAPPAMAYTDAFSVYEPQPAAQPPVATTVPIAPVAPTAPVATTAAQTPAQAPARPRIVSTMGKKSTL